MQPAASEKEVSAFDLPDADMTESAGMEEKKVQNEELDKERDEILELRKELTQKYEPLRIDMAAVRLFFEKLRGITENEQAYWESIEDLVDVILHEFE